MTDMPSVSGPTAPGSLAALWQSGGAVDVEPLVRRLQHQNRRLRRLNQLSFAVCIGALLVILMMEFIGEIPTRGLLSLAGTIAVAGSWWKYRRDKARLIAAYSEEPARLLPFLIRRTRAMRNLGRYYYLCPLPSLAAGYFVGRHLGTETAGGPPDAALQAMTGIGLIVLGAITFWGLRLARTKTAELRELEALQLSLPSESP